MARTRLRVSTARVPALLRTSGGPQSARVSNLPSHDLTHADSDIDALTLKKDGDATITGGGATGAEDKVIQHNGAGTVTINGFQVADFGKLYRSCGNCKQSAERHVVIKNVKASSGKLLIGINPNFGDTATIDSATCATGVKEICEEFKGTTPGNEPESTSTGPSNTCKFTSPLKSC